MFFSRKVITKEKFSLTPTSTFGGSPEGITSLPLPFVSEIFNAAGFMKTL